VGRARYIVIGFTAFLLALLWGAVAYQLDHDKTDAISAARMNTDNLARAYAEHVLGTLRLFDQILLRIRNEYERNPSALDLAEDLRGASNLNAGVILIGIADAAGHVVAATTALPPAARSIGDRDYFLAQADNNSDEMYISKPLTGRITGKRTIIVFSRRLENPDGSFAGIVFTSFDPQFLSGFFSDLTISKDSSFAVIGRDMIVRDMVRGSGRANDAIGQSVAKSQLAKSLAAAPNGDYRAKGVIDGVPRLFAYRALPGYPVLVLASVADEDVLAGYDERNIWFIGIAAVVTLIFVTVAAFQLRRLKLRMRAERELQQTQDLLVESQRVARLGYGLTDVRSNRMYWSDSLFELRGVPWHEWFTREEAIQFTEPEDRGRYIAARDQAIAERRPVAIDVRVCRPDGARSWEHRVIHPNFDEQGELDHVLMVVQDITQRKENELELIRSRENMARAQHVAALGSFERDIVTRKVEWSDEMYRILGLEKGRIVPGYEAILELVHPDDRGRYRAAREAGVEGIATGSLEFRIIRPDGVERIIQRDNELIFDENHRPIRLYGIYHDVTERHSAEERERELERKLMHSQKLEALGTLAGGIAHDLNNTLTPIMALSKISARKLEPGNAVRTNLETIYAASEQARDLVKRVLAFSRREDIEKKPTDLRAIVGDALQLLSATIPASIRLDTRLGEVPPVLANASQIHQVVTNLVSNAAQAIGDAMGVITITLGVVFTPGSDGVIRLSIADTGKGMDERTRRRIFEPFFTTKQVGQGTGLGLAISESIVADHGGRITVESEPGKGARFDVDFPLPASAASAAA